jgi:hypothetical protein
MQQPIAADTGLLAEKIDRARRRQQDVALARFLDHRRKEPLQARHALGQRHRDSGQLAGGGLVKGAAAKVLHEFRDVLAAVGRAVAVGR